MSSNTPTHTSLSSHPVVAKLASAAMLRKSFRFLCLGIIAGFLFFYFSARTMPSDLSTPVRGGLGRVQAVSGGRGGSSWGSWLGMGTGSKELWGDVPVQAEGEFWPWLKAENERLEPGKRRVSWGALKEQGAKSSIWENLRQDRRYLTTFLSSGFTNEFIMIVNLIHVAHLSDRIPILPALNADSGHLLSDAHDLALSEVFDMSQLSLLLGDMPIVELHELKSSKYEPDRLRVAVYDGEVEQTDGHGRRLRMGDIIAAAEPAEEEIGCWSWFQGHGEPGGVWGSWWHRKPAAQYTPIPHAVYDNGNHGQGGSDIVRLSSFLRHAAGIPEQSLEILKEYNFPVPVVQPSAQLACVDMLYFYMEQCRRWDSLEEWRSGTGAWAAVGKHMRFQPGLVGLAEDYLRHAFGVPAGEPIPLYFSVHIRRGDFGEAWLELSPDNFAFAAWEIMRKMKSQLGIHIQHVIVTSDNQDPGWINPLVSYGWHFVDHEAARTSERFGHWVPTLLDAVMLGGAKGFLGVKQSTMSIVAMRRVIDWNGGVGGMVDLNHKVPEDWAWSW